MERTEDGWAPGVGMLPSRAKSWGPEYLFASLLALFGVVFALGIPPIQTPDEPSHFHRAYQVSEGRLTTQPVGSWGGGEIPESVLRVSERFGFLIFHTELHTGAEPFAALQSMPLDPAHRRATPFPGSAYYSFVPYVPQALGIAAARAAGGGPLGVLYAGRLANLALAVVLVFWAVRIMPIYKLVLGTVALLPITVQQFASQSPDASTIGAAFLLIAYLVRWSFASPAVMTGRAVASVCGLAAWLTLCKFPYALVALLYLGVPAARLGGRRRYLAVGACLFLLVFGLAGVLTQLKDNTPGHITTEGRGASIDRQTHFIRAHPLIYAKILASTTVEHGKIWIDQLSMLGWLDTPVNPLAMHVYLAFMMVVALGDRAGPGGPSRRLVGVALVASCLCAALILTMCYVCGNPVRAPLIIGPQGRYFVPLFPLLLLPLYNRVIRVAVDARVLQALTGAACAGVLLVSVVTFVRRYYFPPQRQPLFAMVALLAAAALFAVVAWWAKRRYLAPSGPMVPTEEPSLSPAYSRHMVYSSTSIEVG